jgi:hypothetical protein
LKGIQNMSDFISIGCDPELFGKRKGKFISVHDILPGTKTMPCKVPYGAVQVDGVAAEFNINPAKTSDEFVKNILEVTKVMQEIINQQAKGVRLVAEPTAMFGSKYFESLPFITKLLGCEPDYSAYTGKANPKPETSEPFRTGSGHVHIQTVHSDRFANNVQSEEWMNRCSSLVRELDVTLYHASKLWDKDVKRMELYGKPGAFRPKPYGLEYRVLSNAWLREEGLMRYVFDATVETTKRWLKNDDDSRSIHNKFNSAISTGANLVGGGFCTFVSSLNLPTPLDYGVAF